MHPSAETLNKNIQSVNPNIYDMLSSYGKESYFPALGILSQGAEAATKAKKYNATIGIATENGAAMHLKCIKDMVPGLSPAEIFNYAPPGGVLALRDSWAAKMRQENPTLGSFPVSKPIVTNALTHGLALIGDLFVNSGDTVVLPTHFWENYELLYVTKYGANFSFYDLYNDKRKFNLEGFKKTLITALKAKGKVVTVLNFPNNPTGYSIYKDEAPLIAAAIKEAAQFGKIVAVADDAYYSLFFDDNMLTESIFGYLAGIHENVLAVKVDGATKEEFVWGLRVGFLTYGVKSDGNPAALYTALEQKTMGCLRASISNVSNLSQNLVLKALSHPEFNSQKNQKLETMKARANETRRVLDSRPEFKEFWDYYPFNAGYFMCLKLHSLNANDLRLKVLDTYGVGTIALGTTDLRVAFSCLNVDQIADVFDLIYKAAKDLQNSK